MINTLGALFFLLFLPGIGNYSFILTTKSVLLLLCGDIELNPGPSVDPNCLFANVNSIGANDNQRFNYLKTLVSKHEYKIIGLCEVGNLTGKKEDYELDNYTMLYIPENRGIALYYHDSVVCHKLDKVIRWSNSIWVKLRCNFNNAILGVCYRSPSQSADQRKDYLKELKNSISLAQHQLNTVNDSLLIFGDFNSKNNLFCKSDTTDTSGRQLKILIDDLHLNQMINEPTRITSDSSSCIDLLLTDSPGHLLQHDVIAPIEKSDHCALSVKLNSRCTAPNTNAEKIIWKYDQCNLAELNRSINTYDWSPILDKNVNDCTFLLSTKLMNFFKANIPHAMKIIKPNDQPWFSPKLNTAINKRQRLYKSFKRTQSIFHLNRYIEQDSLVQAMIKNSRISYQNNLLDRLDHAATNVKGYWFLIKKLMGNKFQSIIPPLIDPVSNRTVHSQVDKAHLFLTNLIAKYHLPVNNNPALPVFPNKCPHNINLPRTNPDDVRKVILNLDTNKACGHDLMTNKMLKLCVDSLSPLLARLFNKPIDDSSFPECWKLGTVTVIYKKGSGSKSNPANYRPITLLPSLSKVFERIVYNSISHHLLSNDLIYANQSGFLAGHSTADQLLAITQLAHNVHTTFGNVRESCVIVYNVTFRR
ncbi:uncharacterized protein LOC141906258 [Tubulanus polymorphus]|uniref:uncharacterized protein LOC141906258 n=1 Tax=Tubulanus polymorphus TaxID=672921 RepID=UPI003DA2096B